MFEVYVTEQGNDCEDCFGVYDMPQAPEIGQEIDGFMRVSAIRYVTDDTACVEIEFFA